MTFEGMTVEQAAEHLGKPVQDASRWLRDHGYRYDYTGERKIFRSRGAQQVADEIHDRIQAMRPQSNCFLCGARGECRHR